MNSPPAVLDGFDVVKFALVDAKVVPTRACVHRIGSHIANPPTGLAICAAADEGFYLFGCDARWNVVTDTVYSTFEEALAQAEFEYSGISDHWQKI